MPVEESGLLAAVNQGIADAAPSAPSPAPSPPPETTSDTGTTTASDGDTSAGADDGAGTPGGDAPPTTDGAGASEVQPDAEGAVAGAEAPADPVATQPAGEGEKPPVTPEEALEAALNAPVPNALKRETKERIQTLAGKVKELMPALKEVTQDRDMLVDMVQRTGATPGQYQQSLQYLSLVNSTSRADREKALEMMQAEVSVLSRSLGKPVPGVNFLEGHQDLVQAVGRGQISPEYANEVAAARERSKLEIEGSQQRQQMSRQEQENWAREEELGKAQLNALELGLMRDPQYAAKRPHIIAKLKADKDFQKLRPTERAAAFRKAYDALPAPVAPRPLPGTLPPVAQPANGGGNTPLRASNPAGGARPAPKSMAEAIGIGIAEGSR
jgi:hypothetical protein